MTVWVLGVVFCSVSVCLFVVVSAYFGWVLLFYFRGGGMGCLEVTRGAFVSRDSVSWVVWK